MRTGNTLFSPTAHVVLCESCGAPIEAAILGGLVVCRYCGAQNRVVARSATVSPEPHGPRMPEPERFVRLRQQDGRPMVPPPSVLPLMPEGEIPVWKIQEALAVWQSTRRELSISNSYEAAERLLFLTLGLANRYSDDRDLERQRAMFESALDVFTLPRHRQTMRCYLARAAAKMGDLPGAEGWLSPCDAFSDDLESDSEYRFARALIDTFQGQFPRVLQVLGDVPEAVPIHDAMDVVCTAFRANALEKLGQLPAAVEQLRQRSNKGPREHQTLVRVIEVYRPWGVCALSFARAESAQTAAAAAQAGQLGGMLAAILLSLGATFLLMAAGCLIGIVVALATGEWLWTIGPGVALVVMGPIGVIMVWVGLKARAAAKKS